MTDMNKRIDVWQEAAAKSLDAMHERATTAEAERDRYRAALHEILEVEAPRIDEGEIMCDIAREALGIEDDDG